METFTWDQHQQRTPRTPGRRPNADADGDPSIVEDLGAMLDRSLKISPKAPSKVWSPVGPRPEPWSGPSNGHSPPSGYERGPPPPAPRRQLPRSISGSSVTSNQVVSPYYGFSGNVPVTSPDRPSAPVDLTPRRQYSHMTKEYATLDPRAVVDPQQLQNNQELLELRIRQERERQDREMEQERQRERQALEQRQALERQRQEAQAFQQQQVLQQRQLEEMRRQQQREKLELLRKQREQREHDKEQELQQQRLREQQLQEQFQEQLRQQQLREQEAREQQIREHQLQEQQLHEQQLREKQRREQQLREQEEAAEAERRRLEEAALERQMLEARERSALEQQQRAAIEQARRQAAEAQQPRPQGHPVVEPQMGSPPPAVPVQQEATMVRQTTDPNGNVTTRVIKKGVEDFEFKEELGTGSYSTVVAASDKQTLRQYAIKVLDKAHIIKEAKVKYVEIEKNTLNRLGDHPGIIHLYFTFQDRASLYFVLDFAPNGELLHLIKKIGSLDELCARYYACQLLDAIEYMHSKGVIHRDLKPENILLDYKMRIKITDFGTAKLLDADNSGKYPTDTRATSFVGTAEYVSPELLLNKSQGKSADMWAFGCVLYQMIAAVPPFQGATQYLTFQRIARYQYSIPPGFPFLVRDLLKHVLVDSRRRWGVAEVKQHPFFEGVDWSRKSLWGTPPPKLQPYRPSSSSMNPRGRGTPTPTTPPPVTLPSTTPAVRHVPTAAGLQPVRPATRAGMPTLGHHQPRNTAPTQPSQPKLIVRRGGPAGAGTHSGSGGAGHRATTSQSAAAAALYKDRSSPSLTQSHTPAPSRVPPSGAYTQGQERVNAIMRRVQEQKMGGRPIQGVVPPPVGRPSPSPPGSPSMGTLAQLPVTMVEREWSTVLISSTERILKLGRVFVHIGSNPATDSGAADDSLITKLFAAKKKLRTVMVTTAGRLLVLDNDKKIRTEVPLGVPQVNVREVYPVTGGIHSPAIVVETYNRVLTLDDPATDGTASWLAVFDLSRRYYAQATAEAERDAFSAAAAAAVAVAGSKRS